ncbi:hypothetical protein [Desulfoluna spongiiphila]|uniref:hypothetical protein n=1 Tax=Desulfoluna spongiiphila TaxID=419481 RepID=UPI00111459E8|nr:hypothetical protein [Desulfoluna spongiiphila]
MFCTQDLAGGDPGPPHLDFASGGPVGGQAFEKFDKQVLSAVLVHSNVLVFRLISLKVQATETFCGAFFKKRPAGGNSQLNAFALGGDRSKADKNTKDIKTVIDHRHP